MLSVILPEPPATVFRICAKFRNPAALFAVAVPLISWRHPYQSADGGEMALAGKASSQLASATRRPGAAPPPPNAVTDSSWSKCACSRRALAAASRALLYARGPMRPRLAWPSLTLSPPASAMPYGMAFIVAAGSSAPGSRRADGLRMDVDVDRALIDQALQPLEIAGSNDLDRGIALLHRLRPQQRCRRSALPARAPV
jgi:hypothetical protein